MADTGIGGPTDDAADLLYGLQAIATHLRMTPRQVQHLVEKNQLPTFKMGKTNCTTRAALAEHFAAKVQRKGEPTC